MPDQINVVLGSMLRSLCWGGKTDPTYREAQFAIQIYNLLLDLDFKIKDKKEIEETICYSAQGIWVTFKKMGRK